MLRTKLAAATIVVAGVVGVAAPAFAYDCYNASRSATGASNAAAGAQSWLSIPEALRLFMGADDATVDAVMAVVAEDPRVPTNFVIFLNPHHEGELASRMNDAVKHDGTTLPTNGKGIDHSEDNGVLDALMEDIGIALGGQA